jgi:WxL domain surface cell wall-binding
MRNLISMTRKRLLPLLAASVLLAGGISASLLFTGGTADAVACAGANAEGAACTITGTLTMTSGVLTLTAPPAVAWAETISGADQLLSDPAPADETYTVDDATGTAPGWHVTASATAFQTAGAANTLGTTGSGVTTFSTNGSLALAAGAVAATAPGTNCAGASTCTLPTDSTTYPVVITTADLATPTPVNIYDAAAGTGLGTIVIGYDGPTPPTAANPVGWWLNVPSNTVQGTYTSTISLELITAP